MVRNCYTSVFSNIDKVTTDTRVTYACKPVGEVDEILDVKDPRQGPTDQYGNLYSYELLLKVDSGVQIYTYDEIQYSSSGLMVKKRSTSFQKQLPKANRLQKKLRMIFSMLDQQISWTRHCSS